MSNNTNEGIQLKDVIHFYLGCECLCEKETLHEGWRCFLTDYEIQENYCGRLNIKLLLRPLADIMNTEAFVIYKKYFDKEMAEDWSGDTGSAYFNPKKVRVNSSHAIRIFNGEDYETGDFMKVISLVPYLLKQGFDLFGLIESNQAIDKTVTIYLLDHGGGKN